MRLRDLDVTLGVWPTGRHNAITDVPGLHVAHVDAAAAPVGLTAVVPFGDASQPHRTFLGRWALDDGDEATGIGLARDFGALSTPLVLSPSAAVGRVYDAMLQRALRIDRGLPEDRGWPPAVLPIDGVGPPPAAVRAAISDDLVEALLDGVDEAAPAEGQVGAGRSLLGFGCSAGIGTASRQVEDTLLGVLIAVNGGEPGNLSIAGCNPGLQVSAVAAARARSATAIVVTDAPLLPQQLQRVAGRSLFGLVRVGLLDAGTGAARIWALSTTAPVDDEQILTGTIVAGGVDAAALPMYHAAAAEALEEAVVNALLAAAVDPQGLPALPTGEWPGRIRRMQRSAR